MGIPADSLKRRSGTASGSEVPGSTLATTMVRGMHAHFAKLASRVALLRGIAEGEGSYVGPACVTRRRSSDPQQLARMAGECSCPNCGFWHESRKVHRIWRWVAPVVLLRKKAAVG